MTAQANKCSPQPKTTGVRRTPMTTSPGIRPQRRSSHSAAPHCLPKAPLCSRGLAPAATVMTDSQSGNMALIRSATGRNSSNSSAASRCAASSPPPPAPPAPAPPPPAAPAPAPAAAAPAAAAAAGAAALGSASPSGCAACSGPARARWRRRCRAAARCRRSHRAVTTSITWFRWLEQARLSASSS